MFDSTILHLHRKSCFCFKYYLLLFFLSLLSYCSRTWHTNSRCQFFVLFIGIYDFDWISFTIQFGSIKLILFELIVLDTQPHLLSLIWLRFSNFIAILGLFFFNRFKWYSWAPFLNSLVWKIYAKCNGGNGLKVHFEIIFVWLLCLLSLRPEGIYTSPMGHENNQKTTEKQLLFCFYFSWFLVFVVAFFGSLSFRNLRNAFC